MQTDVGQVYSMGSKDNNYKDDFTMSGGGYSVTRNGVTMSKPDWMSDDYWFTSVAPRVGKGYTKTGEFLFGHDAPVLKEGVDERGDGCDGGACAI